MGRPKGSKNKPKHKPIETKEDVDEFLSTFADQHERSEMVDNCIDIVKEQLAEWEHELTSQE